MTNDFDLNLLRVAVSLYEERGVGEAAAKLRMSQPATSRALAKLRQIFKDELFVRSGYQMVPSPKGRALAISARELLARAKTDLLVNTDFDPSTSETTFCVAVGEVAESYIIPELLQVLSTDAPRASLRSVCPTHDQLLTRMEIGDIDLAFGPFSNLNRSEFVRQKLADVCVVCLIHSDHPYKGEILTADEFAHFNHVEVGREEYIGPFWDRLLAKRQLKRKVAISTTHYASLPGVLKQSQAIATVASSAAVYFCSIDPKLRIVRAPVEITLPGYLYWHSRYQKDARNQFIRQSFKKALLQTKVMKMAEALNRPPEVRKSAPPTYKSRK